MEIFRQVAAQLKADPILGPLVLDYDIPGVEMFAAAR